MIYSYIRNDFSTPNNKLACPGLKAYSDGGIVPIIIKNGAYLNLFEVFPSKMGELAWGFVSTS